MGVVVASSAVAALVIAPLARVEAQQAAGVAMAPAPTGVRALLAGRYRPAPGASNAANRDAGVQRAVNELFLLIRGIAFGRIVEGNPVFPEITIAFPPGQIEVISPPIAARSPDNGGESSIIGLDRERNRLVQRVTADALVQTTWNSAGSRTTRFVPSASGRMILQIEVSSPRLPVPVRYTMAYTRN